MIIKKIITAITIFTLLFGNVGVVLADDAVSTPPPAPTAPDAPVAPTAPATPDAPTPPVVIGPSAEPIAPQYDPNVTPTPMVLPTFAPNPTHTPHPTPTPQPVTVTVTPTPTVTGTGGANANSQSNGAAINTGDANSSAVLGTDVNSNLASNPGSSGSGSAVIGNTNNGTGSNNTSTNSASASSTTTQNNSANIGNSLQQSAVSGDNSASRNTGGDVNVTTGNSNVSGTLITTANTNAAGVTVSEFNIPNSQVGDYVLNFAANCIYNCANGGSNVANTGNGDNSTNNASNVKVVDNSAFQNNTANIDNSLVLKADSGDNRADSNTGGNTNITTGDANVSANSLTMANNNIAGQVLYGVVNIYGDLHGDIIFPEDQLDSCCQTGSTVANTGNGDNSTNTATNTQTTNNTTTQTNVAAINNNLDLNAQTGNNVTHSNTDGNNGITTGDTAVTASVLNVANTNVDGDTWLVLVNNAGTWTGQIMGANGANYAGSSDAQFSVDPNGQITVTNSGNGDGSTNTASSLTTTNNTTSQSNTVNLNNNLDLTANTGGNSASRNTGGDSTVNTGDANIVANLVNFVNNNITGHGKLVVTVVNVFGSWVGDFIGPGQHKEDKPIAVADTPLVQQSNNQNNSNPTPTPTVAQSTPAATPTPKGTNTLVLGASTGTSTGGSIVKVAGYSTENLGNVITKSGKTNKVVHVNLAWLLLLLPVGGILLITKKKLLS